MGFVRVAWAAFAAAVLACTAPLAAEESNPASHGREALPPQPAQPTAAPPASETTPLSDEDKRVLTPEERAQKEARKSCKIAICDVLATKNPEGPDIDCAITKTWREEDIVKMFGGKTSWPWGKAVCESRLVLARGDLAKTMSEPDYDFATATQKVRCTLDRKDDKGEPYVVEVTLAPKVKFKDGKAVEASVNWGRTSAPMLIYPLIYAAAALDNSANVLGPEVAHMVNEFSTKKCAAVKSELPSNKGAGQSPGPSSPPASPKTQPQSDKPQ